eukprot:gene8956-10503_t
MTLRLPESIPLTFPTLCRYQEDVEMPDYATIPTHLALEEAQYFTDIMQMTVTSPQGGYPQDFVVPVLENIKVTPFGGYAMLFTIRITDDNSGVYKFVNSLNGLTSFGAADLISGNHLDGVYEFLVNLESIGTTQDMTTYTIDITDMALNFLSYNSDSFTPANFDFIPKIDHPMQWSPNDFTHFEFEKRICNVTNTAVSNHLYFNVSEFNPLPTFVNRGLKPKLYLMVGSSSDPDMVKKFTFQGAWDPLRNMFSIPFTIPKNLFEGQLQYSLLSCIPLASPIIQSFVGINSSLELISNNADLLGPLITNVVSFSNSLNFGWELTIEDFPNGLASGSLNVLTDYDPVPTAYDIMNRRISGDKYKGVYRVSIPIPKQGRSGQTYTFTAILKDTSFNVANIRYDLASSTNIHPFFKIFNTPSESQLKIPVGLPGYTDNDPPYLVELRTSSPEIDVGLLDRTVTVTFKVKDDISGVYLKNKPYVYISTMYNEFVGAESALVSSIDAHQASYSCNISLPYGFGHLDQLSISVYGMFDNNLNTNGYSGNDLKTASFPDSIKRKYSFVPILESHSKISHQGGEISIYGRKLGDNPIIILTHPNGTDQTIPKTELSFQSQIVLVFTLPAFPSILNNTFYTVKTNNTQSITSNPLKIYAYDAVPLICTGTPQCSDHASIHHSLFSSIPLVQTPRHAVQSDREVYPPTNLEASLPDVYAEGVNQECSYLIGFGTISQQDLFFAKNGVDLAATRLDILETHRYYHVLPVVQRSVDSNRYDMVISIKEDLDTSSINHTVTVYCYAPPDPAISLSPVQSRGVYFSMVATFNPEPEYLIKYKVQYTSPCFTYDWDVITYSSTLFPMNFNPVNSQLCTNYSTDFEINISAYSNPLPSRSFNIISPIIKKSAWNSVVIVALVKIIEYSNNYASFVSNRETVIPRNLVPVLGNYQDGTFMVRSILYSNTTYNLNSIVNGQFVRGDNYTYNMVDSDIGYTLLPKLGGDTLFPTYDIEIAGRTYSPDIPEVVILAANAYTTNIDGLTLTYPFGIGQGVLTSFKSSISIFYSIYLPNIQHSHYYTQTRTSTIARTANTLDTIPPMLSSFRMTPLGGYSMIFTLGITDDLSVSGTIQDGVYEFIVDLETIEQKEMIQFTIYLSDTSLNQRSYSSDRLLASNFDFVSPMDHQMKWSPSDFTHFEFEKRVCNVTNTTVDNHLYFNLTNADRNLKPKLYLKAGATNKDMIKEHTFEGQLQYSILAAFPLSNVLLSALGDNATVEIVSNNGDLLGPLITNIVQFTNLVNFGWELTIEDYPNGLESGYIEVVSDYNPVPIIVEITGCRTTGNKYHAYLRDSTFNVAESLYSDNIDPFFTISNLAAIMPIPLTLPGYSDDAPPILLEFKSDKQTIDVGALDRRVTFTLVVQDIGSGVHPDNNPHVFIATIYNEFVSAEAVPTQTNGDQVTYSCTITLPYGFGNLNRLFLSVYGIYDNNLNMIGYSTNILQEIDGLQSTIERIFSDTPILESHSPIGYQGGLITVYGRKIGENSTINLGVKDGDSVTLNDFTIKSHIVLVFTLPAFPNIVDPYYKLSAYSGSVLSNVLRIHPSGEALQCPGTPICNGNGNCVNVTLYHPLARHLEVWYVEVMVHVSNIKDVFVIKVIMVLNVHLTCNSKKSKLSTSQLIGIILGSVAFAACVAIASSYVIYKNRIHRRDIKNMEQKLKRASQMSE